MQAALLVSSSNNLLQIQLYGKKFSIWIFDSFPSPVVLPYPSSLECASSLYCHFLLHSVIPSTGLGHFSPFPLITSLPCFPLIAPCFPPLFPAFLWFPFLSSAFPWIPLLSLVSSGFPCFLLQRKACFPLISSARLCLPLISSAFPSLPLHFLCFPLLFHVFPCFLFFFLFFIYHSYCLIFPLPSILLLSHLLYIIIFDHSSASPFFCFLFLPPTVSFLSSLCFLSPLKRLSFLLSFAHSLPFSSSFLSSFSLSAFFSCLPLFLYFTHCCLFLSPTFSFSLLLILSPKGENNYNGFCLLSSFNVVLFLSPSLSPSISLLCFPPLSKYTPLLFRDCCLQYTNTYSFALLFSYSVR